MKATEIIQCRGHPLVSASHPTTFEVTAEQELTTAGHCIIGVAADKGSADLTTEFRKILCNDDATLVTTLSCEGVIVAVHARGSRSLTLDHPTDFVWRKSRFICGRTVAIASDTVAASLPEELVLLLRAGKEMTVTMTAMRPG